MRNRIAVLFIPLLLLCGAGSGLAGPKKPARLFRQFCAELEFSGKLFADGQRGKANLEACIFSRKKGVRACQTALGVGRGILNYVRKNHKYFRLSGDVLSGYVLQVTDDRLTEINKLAPKSAYKQMIETRLYIQRVGDHLGTQRASDVPSHLQEDDKKVTPAMLNEAQTRYVGLLQEQLEKERDDRIQECLLRELKKYSKLTGIPSDGG